MGYGITDPMSLALVLMASVTWASPVAPHLPIVAITPELSVPAALSATPTSYMVSSPLLQTEVDQFLKCVKVTKEAYNVGVDAMGYIVVTPSSARTINFKGKDLGLLGCMIEVSDFLKTAAQSSLYGGNTDADFLSLAEVSHEWLVSKGAQGQKRQSATPVSDAANADNTNFFEFFLSDDSDCSNEDLIHSNLNLCYTRAASWASQQVGNVSGSQRLVFSLWPHHNCDKGDEKSYILPTRALALCITKQVFSYSANYVT